MAAPLDLNNVQGDILVGLSKQTETFWFFQIKANRVDDFRQKLARLNGIITTSAQASENREKAREHKKQTKTLMPLGGVNIAFSSKGLAKLGFGTDADDRIQDDIFENGMFDDRAALQDNPADLDPRFQKPIDGVILVCGDCHGTVRKQLAEIKQLFLVGRKDPIVHEVMALAGDVRTGKDSEGNDVSGHEHFGFKDGVSQPVVKGVPTRASSEVLNKVDQGVLLLKRTGDGKMNQRPDWTLDGSILAFRYLPQRVPEFNHFLEQKANFPQTVMPDPGVSKSDFLGARLVGRWKNGTPIEKRPTGPADDQADANNFNFPDRDSPDTSFKCPLAAHIRKTNPRSDLEADRLDPHRIMRRGIPFGPEVSDEEAASHTTTEERGLLFVSYQSDLNLGFHFLQQTWANNESFLKPGTGFDPIVGQNPDDAPREVTGMSTSDSTKSLPLGDHEFVISKGGEYFFSPSIPTLKLFATAA